MSESNNTKILKNFKNIKGTTFHDLFRHKS